MELRKTEITFPNGKTATLPLIRDRLFTPADYLPLFVCDMCGIKEGSDAERADMLFDLIDEIGEDVVGAKVMAGNEQLLCELMAKLE